ncbi:hypothetical protein [Skermania sp. ID1734]|nr:hypothetical protein [Skermania sp. ID1734]
MVAIVVLLAISPLLSSTGPLVGVGVVAGVLLVLAFVEQTQINPRSPS